MAGVAGRGHALLTGDGHGESAGVVLAVADAANLDVRNRVPAVTGDVPRVVPEGRVDRPVRMRAARDDWLSQSTVCGWQAKQDWD